MEKMRFVILQVINVNHVFFLLLMVINLIAITSTSLPFLDHDEELTEIAGRPIRSIDNSHGKTSDDGKTNSKQGKTTKSRSNVFSTENSTIVFAQIGGTASLPCVVKKNSGTVLWLREWQSTSPTLLSVGVNKHTHDDRFYVEHIRHLQNWGLVIKPVRFEDEGVYKCQVSTHPPTIILIELKVTKAYAEITGAPDLHLRAGSSLHLVCEIKHATESPEYVFWYHEDRMINYDAGVRVLSNSPPRGAGGGGWPSNVLIVPDADKSHDGNYTCKPSNAVPAHINVHVLNATEEENPAAMLHANAATPKFTTFPLNFLAVLLMVVVSYLHTEMCQSQLTLGQHLPSEHHR